MYFSTSDYYFIFVKKMNSSSLVSNLYPREIICDFNYWSNFFSQDMQLIWDKGHGVPLNKLPAGVSDMIFLIYY